MLLVMIFGLFVIGNRLSLFGCIIVIVDLVFMR